jgi:hypothetical protein
MFRRFVAIVLPVVVLACATVSGQEGESDKPSPPGPGSQAPRQQVMALALAPAAPAERVLRYPLLPDSLDLTPGNAAQLWLLAGMMAEEANRNIKPDEYGWFFTSKGEEAATLPKKEARQLVGRFDTCLRLADQAARRTYCQWERPPLTLQTNAVGTGLLVEVQSCRVLARFLMLRFRLELSERRFDKAIYSLQTGLTMARHFGNGGTLMEFLVGNPIARILFTGVEEWMRTPGSPDLYWSLTALPSPFLDVRSTCAYELNTIYRSFPPLRRLNLRRSGEVPTKAEVDRLVEELLTGLNNWRGRAGAAWTDKVWMLMVEARFRDRAKKYLLECGWTEDRVKAAPPMAIVLTYLLGQYDDAGDGALKWMTVPPWQGRDELVLVMKRAREAGAEINNPFMLLCPAVDKVYEGWLQTEQMIATLRTGEALRMYAAAHGGMAPAKLSDVTAVQLPIDPATGKGFDHNYAVRDGKAVLEVSLRSWNWRFGVPAGK